MTRAEFLQLADKRYDELQLLNKIDNFYDYEKLTAYAGQLDCYERCNKSLQQFLDIEISAAQLYRVFDTYGNEAEKEVKKTG
jgi:hypothetical protein